MIANPIPWPDDARCAVAMTWEMDADSASTGITRTAPTTPSRHSPGRATTR